MTRFSFCFLPVELGLEFLLSSRLNWIECEKKITVKATNLKELKFDGVPEEVVRKLNEKKKKMLDFLQIQLQMVLEGASLYVVGKEEILGTSKHLVGMLEKEPETWKELPTSLKTFDSAVLVSDISQRDIRKNKNVYQLRTTSLDDEIILEWVNVEDMQVLNQRKQDLELVKLVDSVKLGDGAGTSLDNKEEGNKDDIDDVEDGADNFTDTEEPTNQ